MRETIEAGLPDTFRGWPTRFGWDDVPVSHHVDVVPLGEWLERRARLRSAWRRLDARWLATPQQALLELTAGSVFHDPRGELAAMREELAWYPDDVWLWLLACQWRRLDQEEPFVGRAAEVGDELGSRMVAARLARDVMRLAFLLERRYAPYSKWLGSRSRNSTRLTCFGRPCSTCSPPQSYETERGRSRQRSWKRWPRSTTQQGSRAPWIRPSACSTRDRSAFSAPPASSTRVSSA